MPGVTEQEIAQAKQMNLYQYMQLCEPDNFKPEGPGQFRHKGHSSLTFAEDGSWTYFKTKATGRTALNYLIAVEGVSFVEAVREINRIQGGVRPSFQPVKTPPHPAEKKPAKEFKLPRPDKNNYAATAYLRKRCIHPNVLTVCKQKKILYQASFKDHPNCVFVGRDGNGEPKGGSLRGCSQIQFRRDIPGSKKIYPFYIEAAAAADTVEVYEAPIDAMSGASLKIMQHTGNWRGIVANIQTQFGMPHTGKDLLLDAKMGPNKDQSSRLDSEPDALSDTGMSDDVGAGDTSGILHDSAGGNKNTITGTNTPRSSRTSAYYDLLRSQHKNGHYKAPAYRVVDAIESPLQAGAGALNYHDDFDTDAVQNAGLHIAVAQTVVEGNIMAAAADSAFVIGKQTGNILKDLKDETINAKDALKAGGKVLRLQGGKSVVKIGDATLRSTEQYLSSFQVSTDDFTGSVPGKVKEAATNTGNILKKITNVVLHPLRNLIAMGKVILIGAVILLFLIIVSLLGQMSGTTSTSVFCANRIEDIQTLVQKINDYRNAAVTEGIYQAFQNDVDPNGNPYGYDSLTGQRSNNLQHGVTWNYANGIYNDTAEIISLAAVYYQQDWPRSELLSAFSDNVPFTKFCRALAAYGLDVTARESAPYSCMSYGGCVNGYRSEGEVVSIKDYRLETHTCSEGDDACGQYDAAAEWHWNEGHAENKSYSIWKEDGTHDVTVFFPVIFPDGATGSELSDLPEEYNAVADGKINAADCIGNIVLDESANLYKGELNEWFYAPDELTVTFTVVTGEGDDAVSDDYEVTFSNATAIPWCPGELNDGQYGHYDLDCTIYLTGYDRYTDPETQAPNGADGGTGNLEALAESCDAGTLTRTIIKQDQYGNEYAGNAVSARYTKTITLPNGARGFQGWYKDGEDAYGNVEWASLLYRMDWEELYGIVDGIKCRATGSGMTEEELRQLFASLNIDATTARGQVVAFALSCQGKFVYAQPSSLRGGPGNPSVGINLDCSSFVQYCYWAQNLPFSAGSTAAYRNAADLVSISPSEVQPGDLRVVYASGGEQGHVQMALGGDAWIECCYGYGVAVNMSNAWMESRPCYYFRYAGF